MKNYKYLLPAVLFFLSILNLLFMHYAVTLRCEIEIGLAYVDYYANLVSVVFDVTLFFSFFLLFRRKVRPSLLCCYVITFLWSFSNVLYSRFFDQYISYSAIQQITNLADATMLKCMYGGLRWMDFYYLISLCLFVSLYRRMTDIRAGKMDFVYVWLLCGGMILLEIFANGVYCLKHTSLQNWARLYGITLYNRYIGGMSFAPIYETYTRGCIYVSAIGLKNDLTFWRGLKDKEMQCIESEYKDYHLRRTIDRHPADVENVILIIVESYLSVSSDMKVGGVEVTPFLNALKREKDVYYNGCMQSNVTIGESSDGQFIYMNGLLPLKSCITVSKAKNIKLPGLLRILKSSKKMMKSNMIIPTAPSLWDQQEMCNAYGFDKLYSTNMFSDKKGAWLTDEDVFDMAIQTDESVNNIPFFSVILTVSMHQPYYKTIDTDDIISDSSYPDNFNNYLTACHYTDKQIGRYINWLKQEGIYDKSLIIITADHQAHIDILGMKGEVLEDLPLYIIHGNIDQSTAWTGVCNQLDVYTTILDVLGIENEWMGLGHTLLNREYVNSVNDTIYDLSEKIIRGNYFQNREDK